MPLRKPEQFKAAGSQVFREAPTSRESIRGWVEIARGKANDASNPKNSPSTRLGCAYDCVLTLSLAVLSAHQWRATSADGHHRESLEVACALAGVSVSVFDDMDAVRSLRNDQYMGLAPTTGDVALAIKCMAQLAPQLLALLQPYLR
jgi:hypothetical protein